jgi:diguanylate cyclase (GGDEF)-like protein
MLRWFGGKVARHHPEEAWNLSGSAQEASVRMRAEIDMLTRQKSALEEELSEARAAADRDPLLPVLNRRAFMRELGRTASYIERYGGSAALLYLDMNDFKAINDRYGHPAGDAALQHVARLLLHQVRGSDLVGRIGGDEFAIVLAHANEAEGRYKAQGLARLLTETPFVFEGARHRISASIGVCAFGGANPVGTPEELLARADEAMFAIKHGPLQQKTAAQRA